MIARKTGGGGTVQRASFWKEKGLVVSLPCVPKSWDAQMKYLVAFSHIIQVMCRSAVLVH